MTQKKLSVLMVGPSRDARGGITSVVNGYFNAGIANLCNIHYIGTTSNGGYLSKVWAVLKALHKFIRLLPICDIVHIHLGGGVSMIRKQLFLNLAKHDGKLVIIHDHRPLAHNFSNKGPSFVKKNRKFFARADAVIVLSEGERQFYLKRKLCSPEKIYIIHNSVAIPAQNDFSFTTKKIINLAPMTKRKGQDVLIRAIPAVVRKVPEATFVFAGTGRISLYRQLAERVGVINFCKFRGWVSGKRKENIYQHATLYIQASRDEGMSMSLLEAMAHGLPVVATNVGGTSLIVQDGVEGFLVPSSDSNTLANRIIDVIKNKNLALKMSISARYQIENNFNIHKQIEKLITLYQNLFRKEHCVNGILS